MWIRAMIVFSGILLAGCRKTVEVDGFNVAQRGWDKAKVVLVNKARFDLECDDVQLTVLNAIRDSAGPAESVYSVGVIGCGRRARYERVVGQWVMNHGSEAAPKPQ